MFLIFIGMRHGNEPSIHNQSISLPRFSGIFFRKEGVAVNRRCLILNNGGGGYNASDNRLWDAHPSLSAIESSMPLIKSTTGCAPVNLDLPAHLNQWILTSYWHPHALKDGGVMARRINENIPATLITCLHGWNTPAEIFSILFWLFFLWYASKILTPLYYEQASSFANRMHSYALHISWHNAFAQRWWLFLMQEYGRFY